MSRGQTTLDFLIGISTFLLVIGLTFTMIPGIVDPFAGSRDASPLVADSAADQLAKEELAQSGTSYVLNETATDRFFNRSRTSEADIKDRLAVGEHININVTLTNETTTRAVGDTPPNASASVYAAWRVVSVDGEQADLRVRVW